MDPQPVKFLTLLGLVLLISGQTLAATPRVLVLEPRLVGSEDDETARVLSTLVTSQLELEHTIEVVSADELADVADLEGAEVRCADMDCAFEIAGAMGVSHVVFGLLTRSEDRTLSLQLGLLDVQTVKLLHTEQLQVAQIEQLPDALEPAVARLAAVLVGKPLPEPPVVAPRDPGPARAREPSASTEAESAEQDGEGSGSTALWGGLGLAALAGAVVVGSAALSWKFREDLLDPAASRLAKDTALSAGPAVMLGGTALGAALLTGGCALGVVGLWP